MEEPIEVTIGIEEADNGVMVRWEDNEGTTHVVYQTDDGGSPKVENIRKISQELGRMIYQGVRQSLDETKFSQIILKLEYLPVPTYRKEEE